MHDVADSVLNKWFKLVDGGDIKFTFIFERQFLHPFFWNGINLLDGRSTALWSKAGTRLRIWQCSTIDSDVSGYATVEAEVVVNMALAFLWSKSSMTVALVLSERRGSWEGIDLRFFFQDFLNAWILSSESSGRASKGAPVFIEFSGFLD